MKQSKISTILWSVIISLGMIFSLGSCREPEPTPEPQPPTPEDSTVVVTPEFSVEFKEATSSSLTFVATTTRISQLAYDILPASEEGYVDPLNLFEVGETIEIEADGSYEITFEDLAHLTEYKAYVAAVDTAGGYLANMAVVSGSTLDFEEDVTVYDVTADSFNIQVRMPELQNEDNVIKWGLAELATYNMNSKMSMWGYTTDAEILNMADDVYHNYFRNDTTFVINNENSVVYDPQGNPVDDGMGGILTYYNPIVPGQPNIFLLGEFAYGEHPWGFGMGYYSPLFDQDAFLNDYYGSGPSPRQMDENTLNEADYWNGYYSKIEFRNLQPSPLDADFNVDMKLTPKGGTITISPDSEIMQYIFLAMDQDTYDMVLPYLNNDPTLMQWYVTSYNAMMLLGATAVMGDMMINLEELFYEMYKDTNYYLFLVGMSDESGMEQVYEEIVFTLPEATKPAPKVNVKAISNPYGEESPYQIWFNVQAPDGDLEEAYYLCNYSREFDNILSMGETYSNYMSYYGSEFSENDIYAINSSEGLNVMFTTMPNVQSRLVVQGVNDEGTPSDVDNDENAFADNKSIRVLPKERVESPLFEELTGEWTATATVWYNTYINNVLTKIDTTVVSKVVIGETTSAETTPEEVYDVYKEALGAEYSKEYVDALYADFRQEQEIFNTDVRSQNRLLCLGFDFAYDSWNEKRIGSATPYELFIHDSYGAVNNAGIYYDFGNKWYLEIDKDGNLTAPFNSDRLYPTNAWNYSSELFLSGITPADGQGYAYSIMRPVGDPEIWPAFDVELSDDQNTITIKAYDLNGMPAYPNLSYENYGYSYVVSWTVCSEVVLTRGWDESNNYGGIGSTSLSYDSATSNVKSTSSASSAVRPYAKTMMMPVSKVEYQTLDYKAVTCEQFQQNVINFVNANNKRR